MANPLPPSNTQLPVAAPNEPDLVLVELQRQREHLERFLRRNQPRQQRLSGLAVTGSSLAAVLTAAPALGGAGIHRRADGTAQPAIALMALDLCRCSPALRAGVRQQPGAAV